MKTTDQTKQSLEQLRLAANQIDKGKSLEEFLSNWEILEGQDIDEAIREADKKIFSAQPKTESGL